MLTRAELTADPGLHWFQRGVLTQRRNGATRSGVAPLRELSFFKAPSVRARVATPDTIARLCCSPAIDSGDWPTRAPESSSRPSRSRDAFHALVTTTTGSHTPPPRFPTARPDIAGTQATRGLRCSRLLCADRRVPSNHCCGTRAAIA